MTETLLWLGVYATLIITSFTYYNYWRLIKILEAGFERRDSLKDFPAKNNDCDQANHVDLSDDWHKFENFE